ncbi:MULTISPECIES: acyl-CoA thioesterase domain-containing protein [Bradyrhizobium]|uniref:Thioesterase-like superfamily protein n=2 Tax=Bradyrhizobium TaxID=374 RepID=A0ABY0PVM0_9BRAD|nr:MULTISPECIES: acyl-CoA thioesterase domain-containing protein [Bradyrhizobium]SDJ01580.1 Thioesterase-like superfamily protein [Bradyrhizobium ottawaense]SED01008.1 Thioesterase-like superfamily protein [Bradyrhizobium lablabi]SHL08083.1 Thioesterase-like superfamily protein [Bradyrhizobium lablabi]
MAIFEPSGHPHRWNPSALAAGPFAGLQGGAVASLLTAEIEAQAGERKWGTAISASAWFLRPTPMTDLRTQLSVVSEGGRVSVIDNTLWPANDDQPCATVRVTLSRERAVEIPVLPDSGFADPVSAAIDPLRFPVRTRRAAHGKPWFMDAMEAREGDGVAWFRLDHAIIDGAGCLPLSSLLGPADWTHGIARPVQNVVADPNPNLTVQLFRPPSSPWVGVRAETRWRPAAGLGAGSGVLLDVMGEIGRVSMSVILVPFPKVAAEGASKPIPASG